MGRRYFFHLGGAQVPPYSLGAIQVRTLQGDFGVLRVDARQVI